MATRGSCCRQKRASGDCVSLLHSIMFSFNVPTLFFTICNFSQVLEVIAAIKGEDAEKLSEIFYNNTMKVFFSD